jgi:hypothetical protein
MQRNNVTTRHYRIGKNVYIIIRIEQSSTANAPIGNALVSNQADVNVFVHKQGKKKK